MKGSKSISMRKSNGFMSTCMTYQFISSTNGLELGGDFTGIIRTEIGTGDISEMCI